MNCSTQSINADSSHRPGGRASSLSPESPLYATSAPQHARATQIVRQRRPLLDALVGRLLVEETLDQAALEDLVAAYTKKAAE